MITDQERIRELKIALNLGAISKKNYLRLIGEMREIRIGEIVIIQEREYILINSPKSNGTMHWEQPILKLLKNTIQNNQRKTKPTYQKRFKGIKLTKLKGGLKK